MTRMPTYFISHGGGPWPWIPDMRRGFAKLERSLAAMPDELPEPPKAILMISGHWEADEVRVMHAAKPPMEYDYFGFPPHTYQITYPAPGAPELAERTAELIRDAGFDVTLDETQGFDHGTFVPAYIMYPEAQVPVYQVSLLANYSPEQHFAIGRALAPLRDEGVLIVGSGLSYHNLRNFGPQAKAPSMAFDDWLGKTLDAAPDARTEALVDWETAPYARICHAQEDHLVPLFVALGAAEGATATRTYHEDDIFGGVTASSWRFD
ncbi:class III extradiol ring-cleavage dioxygenase [Maritimibacter sp. DP1N21-5]|uniref:DODA-type extradiol aromatic ring-opening family dioxygenase n=1 Tax=Maritimibacter sp. DP1N21-5 TaxID=2836867 RepID=UPI001C48EF77|nr:class III extradiol ring-cleavage dioxygenase [Maritimibacter sp. DP1N21-5]MBV7408372.1 dioxygenase [Maritimibacter sp. DP1N21-5]